MVLVEKGEGVTVNDFGNEGSGGQSYLTFDWEAGKTYRFLSRVRPVGEGYSEYTAYFCPPEEEEWRLIAVWKRPKTQTWYRGANSFLENFLPAQGWIDRSVGFGNQWARSTDGEWYEVTRATFTCDNTGAQGIRLDYTGWADEERFWLRNCGFFNGDVAAGTVMTHPASGGAPNIDFGALGRP